MVTKFFPYRLEIALEDMIDAIKELRDMHDYKRKDADNYAMACIKAGREPSEKAIKFKETEARRLGQCLVKFETFKEAATGAVAHERARAERYMHEFEDARDDYATPERRGRDWWLRDMDRCTLNGTYTRTEYLLDNPEAQIAIYGHIRLKPEDYEVTWQN